MMNLEQCCRKIIYDDLVRHCLDAECFRHQSKAEYYFEEDKASYKNYFNRINKDFNRDFNDIKKFFNSSNHLTRKLRRRIIAEARYKFRRELELKKIDDDIFYNPNLKPLNFTTNGDYSKYDEEQEFPKYDSIHLAVIEKAKAAQKALDSIGKYIDQVVKNIEKAMKEKNWN